MLPSVDDIRRTAAAPMARRGVVRASVLGSFARGDATEVSDIDFLVEVEEGRTLLDLAGSCVRLVCGACGYAIEAWSAGNTYHFDEDGAKTFAYHPDHDLLALCIGNDEPDLW